jgi:metal-sulfur cluster biosynthetic enzyme
MQASDQSQVLEALRTVIDPEVGVNVVDLGLVYGVDCDKRGVRVKMTMSTPACPLGESILEDARAAIRNAVGDKVGIAIDLVWEPEWTPERMSDAARDALGW